MEAYAQTIGAAWSPYLTKASLTAVNVRARGRKCADLGRRLRSLKFWDARPGETREEVDAILDFFHARGVTHAWHFGFRLAAEPVAQADFLARWSAEGDRIGDIVEQARKYGVEIIFVRVHAPPRHGGRLQDLHYHAIAIGDRADFARLMKYLADLPTVWAGEDPRPVGKLTGYLERPPAIAHPKPGRTIDPADEWSPEWAYKFARLIQGRHLHWTRYYGAFLRYRRDDARKGKRPPQTPGGEWKPRTIRAPRQRHAQADGEAIEWIGTYRDEDGEVWPCLFVRGYRGDYDALAAKYDLTAAEAWGDTYQSKSTVNPESPSAAIEQWSYLLTLLPDGIAIESLSQAEYANYLLEDPTDDLFDAAF